MAQEAGFDISKLDWLEYQAKQVELSDEELEDVSGGTQLESIVDKAYEKELAKKEILLNDLHT